MSQPMSAYPAKLSIDYPDRKLNRLTSFFRIFVVIPILIILALLCSIPLSSSENAKWNFQYFAPGIIFIPIVLMLLFRQKYPRWWFDWNVAFTKFSYRVCSYLFLLRDEYPSTDEEQAVHIEIPYPDAQKDLKRWLPLVKWLLAIPHYIILTFLFIAAFICAIITWFAILFTGRYPKSLFNFVLGVNRWGLRVMVYAFILTTDRYPPFSLKE